MTALAAILISSKFEDVLPISASQLVARAGHGKFTVQQLFEKELDILQTLSFLLNERASVYHEASLLYSNLQDQVLSRCPGIKPSILLEGARYIEYLTYLTAYSITACQNDPRD